MKKTFTLIIVLTLVSFIAGAQITTAEMPVVGTHIVYKSINKNGFDALITTTGVGVTWNYINIIEKPDSVTMDYVDPTTTTEGASFPTATIAEAMPPDTLGHFFYELSGGVFYRNGFFDAGNNLLLPYNNNLKLYQLPFQFGTQFNDAYSCTNGTMDIGGTLYPAQIDDGAYSSDVDGSGTLRLPTGRFDNVYRISYTESFTIKADIGLGTFTGLLGISEYGYEYWKAGHVKPILTYYNTSTDDLIQGGTTTTIGIRYDKHAVPDGPNMGIEENDAAVYANIFPNPSAGIINIDLLMPAQRMNFEVYDLPGNMVFSMKMNEKHNGINLGFLAKGIYTYKLFSETFIKQGKLILN